MTIIIKKENIFNQDVQAIVNPVNCIGASGAGLAKDFKTLFPDNYKKYHSYCSNKLLKVGKVLVYKLNPEKYKIMPRNS